MREFLRRFAGLAGLQITGDETQVSVPECRYARCRDMSRLARVKQFTAETAKVCELYGKQVQMRTWQRTQELEAECHPSKKAGGLAGNVSFSIKNTRAIFIFRIRWTRRF